ncbi:hypothetical protein DCAR_0522182 [Daucus carota subsp. sativus]|uniref:Uncharacterized protein n=1 Tax=Daucus carota subsp. sativus TaxID=79200 RepID=A0A164ZMX4_DAUCS|nr:hypothetical protein DCAR_0522182 [Daucus carota subsp. sativus]
MREKQERESFKFSNFKKTEKFASDGNQWFRVTRDAINGKRKIIAVDKDVPETKSYARVVSEDSRNEKEAKRPTIKERVDNRKWFSVMVVNLPPEASVRDIWLFFNKQRLIKDIILPRKRDIRNNRIGFIIVDNLGLAETLVRNFHQKQMGRWKLMVKISDRKSGKDKMDSSEDKKDTNHSDKKEAAAERANKCFVQSSEEDICTPMRENGNIGIMEDDQQNIIGTENDALMGNNIVLEESGTNSQINHPEHLEEVAKEISVNPVRRDLEDRDNLSMNVGVIVSQEVDKVLETPMDVIPGFYVEECVSDRDMDIITGLESSLPEILNNAWCVRDRTSSQSSEQTSVKLLDNSEEELGNDLGVFDSEAVVPPKIIDQVTQLSIGRKRGRPRKYARVYNFANKRKGTNVRRNPPSAKEDLPVNKISVSKKEKRKNIRQSKLKELESLDKENSTAMGTRKDLALQVLETGELLGLIPLEDRELTLSKIRNHIAESDH